ncbi:uncharacterized protein LOC108603399 isoform X2 [Drosophila busckii]|uniref:uncharacterized protein LOC108603399 isoform X2 n=1 Tax=Drosophila busckii TaxID=30019 RepID=UPI00083F48AA|nr:uncharacterized protein LOC108603399 isoform X2 [Drosophila busckii]
MSNLNFLSTLVLSELKDIGIKHKEKRTKLVPNASGQRLFRQRLQELKLTDAFLANGSVVQVPQFVTEACSYILENSETEGIFRKAGSAVKQREIRTCLEAGLPLGKSHRVIDIANILSFFFRELPEPLIPKFLHDTLVRCLQIEERDRIRAIQLTCLLSQPLTLHTLAYFMQFLNTVSTHVAVNKMSAENLAIVISPSVMPYRDINSIRFKNHIKLVELLIQNANLIGTIPMHIENQLQITVLRADASQTPKRKVNDNSGGTSNRKKRRSQIFNGFKTIVGSTLGSSDQLDCSLKTVCANTANRAANRKAQRNLPIQTEVALLKKRKFAEPLNAFRAKKIDIKVPTKSTTGKQVTNNAGTETNNANTIMERRWSLSSSGWTKYKKKDKLVNKLCTSISDILDKDVSPNDKEFISNAIVAKAIEAVDPKKDCTMEKTCDGKTGLVVPIRTEWHENSLKNCEPLDSIIENKTRRNTLHEFEETNFTPADELTERLYNKLKICKNTDVHPKRSPSLRIKAPQKTQHIVRNKTWHISAATEQHEDLMVSKNVNLLNLKTSGQISLLQKDIDCEQWLPAESFFKNLSCDKTPISKKCDKLSSRIQIPEMSKSVFHTVSTVNLISNSKENFQTPMRRTKFQPRCFSTKVSAILDEDKGRDSIARLRTENAGMVLAKAKLFNQLNCCADSNIGLKYCGKRNRRLFQTFLKT